MRKVLIITISTLIFFGLNSFTKSNNPFDELIGTWHSTVIEGGHAVEYVRGKKPLEEIDQFAFGGGIKFMENGELIVRDIAGYCDTPPIAYRNFGGSWEVLSDSARRIKLKYNLHREKWELEWEILELDSNNLKVKVLSARSFDLVANKVKQYLDMDDIGNLEIKN